MGARLDRRAPEGGHGGLRALVGPALGAGQAAVGRARGCVDGREVKSRRQGGEVVLPSPLARGERRLQGMIAPISKPSPAASEEVGQQILVLLIGSAVVVIALAVVAIVLWFAYRVYVEQRAASQGEQQTRQSRAAQEAALREAAEATRRSAEAANTERVVAERAAVDRARWQRLATAFGEENASRVMRREIWKGETQEMLFESYGHPHAKEEIVKKTKTTHIFKYDELAKGRYRVRVTVEQNVIVGWETK